MAQANISVRFELRERDPDGSSCFACHDVVYLKAYDLEIRHVGEVISVDGVPVGRVGEAAAPITAGMLCQSCADMFEADDEPISDLPP